MSSFERKSIQTKVLWPNDGQITGLPANPRYIKDDKFEKLKKSILDDPEFMQLRELVVVEYADEFVIIGGNMRFRACVDLGIQEVPCKILPRDTPIEKMKAFIMKDNISYGSNDWDLISNEWDEKQLEDWGMDLPLFVEEEINDEQIKLSSKNTKIVIELSNDDNQGSIKKAIEESIKGFPEATIK